MCYDSSRMIQIQCELTQRCLELLSLPEGQPCFVLDVGFVDVRAKDIQSLSFTCLTQLLAVNI